MDLSPEAKHNEGSLKAPLNTTVHLLRHFGPGWLMFRLGYAFRQRSGVLRRTLPATSWEDQPLSSFLHDPALAKPQAFAEHRRCADQAFFFDASSAATCREVFAKWDASGAGPVEIADDPWVYSSRRTPSLVFTDVVVSGI